MPAQLLKIVDKERYRVPSVRWLVAATGPALFLLHNRTNLLKRRAGQPLEVIDEPAGSAMNHHERRPHVRVAYRAYPVSDTVDHYVRLAHRRSVAQGSGKVVT